MHYIIWHYSPIHISPSPQHSTEQIITGSLSTLKGQVYSTAHHRTIRILSPHHLLPLSW